MSSLAVRARTVRRRIPSQAAGSGRLHPAGCVTEKGHPSDVCRTARWPLTPQQAPPDGGRVPSCILSTPAQHRSEGTALLTRSGIRQALPPTPTWPRCTAGCPGVANMIPSIGGLGKCSFGSLLVHSVLLGAMLVDNRHQVCYSPRTQPGAASLGLRVGSPGAGSPGEDLAAEPVLHRGS